MKRTILVVDDEHLIAETLSEILAWDGYDVARASNGAIALEAIADKAPDLLLIDLMMPRKDGISAIRELRARQETENLPIILMTAAPQSIEGPVGYDALLVKPFRIAALRAAIKQALEARSR